MLRRLATLILVFIACATWTTSASVVDQSLRIDCNPDQNADEAACRARGCEWAPAHDKFDTSIPWFVCKSMAYRHVGGQSIGSLVTNRAHTFLFRCYFLPSTGYVVVATNATNPISLTKAPKSVNNPFGGDTLDVTFEARSIGAGVRVTIGAADR